MNKKNLSRGVLLVNLGTPDSPTPKSVRKYLKEFLSDKRIIDIFWLFRLLLLYCIILPIRSKKSANLYKNIWTQQGSPLLHWTLTAKNALQNKLGENYSVVAAMRYGSPSIQSALAELYQKNISDITVIPLFPQYAASTTGSVIEAVSNELNKLWHIPEYRFVKSFFQNKYFIDAQKHRLLSVIHNHKPDFILFSYHGLPVRHLEKSKKNYLQTNCLKESSCCALYNEKNHFCYRAQCFQTTRLIAHACDLNDNQFMTTFQSRFGRGKWITPDTQNILTTLRQKGIQKLAVICPGFVSDCLETLEEIEIRLQKSWIDCGGTELVLVESLNDNRIWIQCLEEIISSD